MNGNVKFLDRIIILLSVLHVCIFNFLDISGQSIKIISLLILVSFFYGGKVLKRNITKIGMLLSSLCICFASARLGHNNHLDVFLSNCLSILYSGLPLIFFSEFIVRHFEYVDKILIKYFWGLNVYAIFNIIISILQVRTPGFFAGFSVWENPMEEDLISGTLGYSCTPQLGLFFCFIIFYNIYYCMRKPEKKWVKCYVVFLLIYLLIISMFNDNKAVYFELVMCGVLYLTVNKKTNFNNKMNIKSIRIYLSIFALSIGGIMIYYLFPTFKNLLDDNIFYSVELFMEATKSESVFNYGSAERIFAVTKAFSKYDAMKLGYGTGAYIWHAGDALGFRYFGLADLGSFLCLGGVWFTISILFFFSFCSIDIVGLKGEIKSKILIGVIVIVMFFYCQIVSTNTMTMIWIFYLTIMGMIYGYSNKKLGIKK